MGFFYSVANMHRKYILIREIKANNLNLVFWKKCFMVKSEETLPICHVHKNIEFLCVKNISGLGERHSSLSPKQSHQTKSQEFPEHFHSFTDIIFQFKFRLWLSDLLNHAINSDIKVLNHVLLTLASVGQIVDCETFKDILMEDERTLQRIELLSVDLCYKLYVRRLQMLENEELSVWRCNTTKEFSIGS